MSYTEHTSSAVGISARGTVITLSDSRTLETDESGQLIERLLSANGHRLAGRFVIPDEPRLLESTLAPLLAGDTIDLIVTNGGTGISPRDQTIPTIEKMLDVILPGFGELFRMLSYEQIKSGALLSRAIGGIARGKLLFALPGSPAAVELAMTRLILPELGHLLKQLGKPPKI